MVNLEKDLFLGFYIIRKLMEARKLSVEVESTPVGVTSYPWKGGRQIHILNWDRIDEHYDYLASTSETISLRDLCNLFVHSYVYMPLMSDDRTLEALLVSSDRSRHKKLFSVDAVQTVALFRAVAGDDPVRLEMGRDYAVRLYQGVPPAVRT
jgi:hypothetical protein